jgi:CheY-like chemotaxis protein
LDLALYVAPLVRTLPSGRILVVEDEPAIALCLHGIIHGLGCTGIGPVGRLATAMDLARNEAIDAALLDVNLGNGDFVYPVARALEARGIPFAFVTAYPSSALDGAFCQHAVVNKPFRLAEVRSCVRRLLPDGWRAAST